MGSCSSKNSVGSYALNLFIALIHGLFVFGNQIIDDVQSASKIQMKDSQEFDINKKHFAALIKKMSVNYLKIPNKIHRQESQFQKGGEFDGLIYGLVGLNNLGNTCFMNSAIQCLSNVPPLCDYFLSYLHEKEINTKNNLGSQGEITFSFAELLQDLWTTEEQSYNPSAFLKTLGKFGPEFANGSQHDSHEFLAFLLDILHEDLNRVLKKPYVEGKDYNDSLFEEYAIESWKQYLMRNESIIVDLFQGQIKSSLQCLECHMVSHKFETFMYLSVPIPETTSKSKSKNDKNQSFSLTDCILEFTKTEKLGKDEYWFCPRCKKHCKSTKKMDLWKLPNILIIHIKRFKFDKQNKGKLTNPISFQLQNFDLSSISSGKQRDRPIYDLFAISNHEGTLSSGHYTTFAKNRADQKWYFFNDSRVFELENPSDMENNENSYMLFYSKTSVNEFYRQTLNAPESWPHFFASDESTKLSNQSSDENKLKQLNSMTSTRKKISKQHTYQFSNIFDSKISSQQLKQQNTIKGNSLIDPKSQPEKNLIKTKIITQNSTNVQSTNFEGHFQIITQGQVSEEDQNGNLDGSFTEDKNQTNINFNIQSSNHSNGINFTGNLNSRINKGKQTSK